MSFEKILTGAFAPALFASSNRVILQAARRGEAMAASRASTPNGAGILTREAFPVWTNSLALQDTKGATNL